MAHFEEMDQGVPDERALLQRVTEMETAYQQCLDAFRELQGPLEQYCRLVPQLQMLEEYYQCGQWLRDFEADEDGLLPSDLKRGVLSEDGLWNLLEEHSQAVRLMKEIADCLPG